MAISVQTEIYEFIVMPELTPTQQKFVLHWGEMGTRWGINRTVGQIYALLYAAREPINADEIAEALGFSRVWFYDTQMLSADCFVAMAACALKTTRIRLGTGVLIPSNRIAAVTANAFASHEPSATCCTLPS